MLCKCLSVFLVLFFLHVNIGCINRNFEQCRSINNYEVNVALRLCGSFEIVNTNPAVIRFSFNCVSSEDILFPDEDYSYCVYAKDVDGRREVDGCPGSPRYLHGLNSWCFISGNMGARGGFQRMFELEIPMDCKIEACDALIVAIPIIPFEEFRKFKKIVQFNNDVNFYTHKYLYFFEIIKDGNFVSENILLPLANDKCNNKESMYYRDLLGVFGHECGL